jgi:hypothetical protein
MCLQYSPVARPKHHQHLTPLTTRLHPYHYLSHSSALSAVERLSTRLGHQPPPHPPSTLASDPDLSFHPINQPHTNNMPSATGANWEKHQKTFADDEKEEKKIAPLTDE